MSNPFDINIETENISYDEYGNPIIRISSSQQVETDPITGVEVHKTINRTIQLKDGLQYHPAMSSAQNPNPIYVTTCAICRDPKLTKKTSHGLISLNSARRCYSCGKALCPEHSKFIDNEYYCIRPCAKKLKFKNFLKAIFFKEED